ncbi:RNA polymerase subunit sigma-70 [Streptomyces sp. NPDC088725]|uniref:RNA polymerase subunit sigma-70 n=1 Tax=Streptomyces sp. NPDC088725 TaxID=3365873 RepID=UPI00380B6D2E
MRQRQSAMERRRAREFDAFVAGAGGRLLHAAALLTAEPPDATPRAQRLLTAALAATYADWDRLRDPLHGEDPYDHARRELVARFARGAWRERRAAGGVLCALGAQERLVVVLRLYEGAAEEQTAALTGLPVERVRATCARAVTRLWDTTRPDTPGPADAP